jgi:hypothetical protein
MFGKRFTRALVVTTAGTLIMASAAFADTITTTNEIVSGSDTGTSADTKAPGDTGTIFVYLDSSDNSTDPQNGCNATGNNPATLGVAVSAADASKVSINSPGSVTVTGCGPTAAASIGYAILAGASGSVSVSVTYSSGGRGGDYTSDIFTINISSVTNQAPSTPGQPNATSPNQGAFTLNWTASTDDGLPNPPAAATYALQGKDANDLAFTSIQTGIATNSYTFGSGQPAEGTWTYQVQASDSALTSDWSASSDPIVVDRTNPTFGACTGGPFLRNSGSGSQSVSITSTDPALLDGSAGSDINAGASTLSGTISTTTVGEKAFTFASVDNAGNSATKECKYQVVLSVTGFDRPVDMTMRNVAKAGQAIPLKFQVSDALGAVTDLTVSDVKVTVATLTCDRGETLDAVEEYATGSSGLQNLGGGFYQFNWSTPKAYASSCKSMTLTAGGGAKSATFEFKK